MIEQEALSIVAIQGADRIPVPIASMTVLLLGPGISITHAAVKAVCDNGCTIVWCGERAARFYAVGLGETRSAQNLLLQAHLCMKEDRHMEVVRRMYRRRFPEIDCEGMTLQQIRGMEGIRVREAYRQAARQYGVQWKGRDCKQENWEDADDLNRALSMANAVLYGLCQAAIVSLGFSTGLGFVHTGKMLSFVYDIADLYKARTTIPAAFSVVSGSYDDLGRQVRIACRQKFREQQVLKRIPLDIAWIFDVTIGESGEQTEALAMGELWDEYGQTLPGGINYAPKE